MKTSRFLAVLVFPVQWIARHLFQFLKWLFHFLVETIEVLINSASPEKDSFDASFLPERSVLSSFNRGLCLTGIRSLSIKDSCNHALVIGGVGSGKTSCVILPSIYSMAQYGSSIVCHDPSGEIYQASASYLVSKGYKLKVLHFNKPEMSDGYNPILRATSSSDIYKVATVIVQNSLGKSNTDAFWNSQAIGFISLICMILKRQDAKFQTLSNVKHLVDCYSAEPEVVDMLVAKCNDDGLLREYRNYLKCEKKVMQNIIATCRSALMLFADEAVQKVTSFDTIDFDAFRKEKTALFIMNKTSDLPYYAPLTSTFFLQYFNHILSLPVPRRGERMIAFLIDEASSLYLPNTLQIALANLRKYLCSIALVIQDENQLEHSYGRAEADSIKNICYSKVYFPGMPIATAREIEAMLGKREFEDKDGHKKTRVLMTADEIRSMSKSHAMIFVGANRAIHAYMKPYYKRRAFASYSKMSAPDMNRNLAPFSVIPVIGKEHGTDQE